MRFTRRVRDRRLTSAVVAVAAIGVMASCSSGDDPGVATDADAGPDATMLPDTGAPTTADATADSSARDAGPFRRCSAGCRLRVVLVCDVALDDASGRRRTTTDSTSRIPPKDFAPYFAMKPSPVGAPTGAVSSVVGWTRARA